MSLFNLSILQAFIKSYKDIRQNKGNNKTAKDDIDKKCDELELDFSTAANDPDKWIAIILKLGDVADNAQNQKYVNRYLPVWLQKTAGEFKLVETQSDLALNLHAIRRFLLNSILQKHYVNDSERQLQATMLERLQLKIHELNDQRRTAHTHWQTAQDNPKSLQNDIQAKREEYLKILKQLAYLGELKHVFDHYAELFPTFAMPKANGLGADTTDPLKCFNSRKPLILHDNFDHYYIHHVMQEENRALIQSLQFLPLQQTTATTPPSVTAQQPAASHAVMIYKQTSSSSSAAGTQTLMGSPSSHNQQSPGQLRSLQEQQNQGQSVHSNSDASGVEEGMQEFKLSSTPPKSTSSAAILTSLGVSGANLQVLAHTLQPPPNPSSGEAPTDSRPHLLQPVNLASASSASLPDSKEVNTTPKFVAPNGVEYTLGRMPSKKVLGELFSLCQKEAGLKYQAIKADLERQQAELQTQMPLHAASARM